ncbi:hypothetical protein TRVL_06520 [Trypanosoma vivax]|nr:hypothetical protein TRVL_06520 [Trypanosoma vivax]
MGMRLPVAQTPAMGGHYKCGITRPCFGPYLLFTNARWSATIAFTDVTEVKVSKPGHKKVRATQRKGRDFSASEESAWTRQKGSGRAQKNTFGGEVDGDIASWENDEHDEYGARESESLIEHGVPHRRERPLLASDEAAGGLDLDEEEVNASDVDSVPETSPLHGVTDSNPLDAQESRYLKDCFPDLAAEYDADANGQPLSEVLADSALVVSWKCLECEFKWKSGVFVRTCLRTKCPQCEQERNPRLAVHLVQLWDHSLNDPCVDPKTVTASSSKSAYWRCSNCGMSYQARIKDMASEKAKCPSCSMLSLHADFSKGENNLLQEWHPIKNGDLLPSQIQPTDPTKLWWLCMACGHEWEATLAARLSKSRRARGKGCPVCHGKGRE